MFAVRNLSVIACANSFMLWHYNGDDADIATITAIMCSSTASAGRRAAMARRRVAREGVMARRSWLKEQPLLGQFPEDRNTA